MTLYGADKIKRAKAYGKAHGYTGRTGGWIYDKDGDRITQGWWSFYDRNAAAIEYWAGYVARKAN